MFCSCGHANGDHVVLSTCQEQVHYPDEDYPCICSDFAPGADPSTCAECGHRAEQHVEMMRCKPPREEACSCTRVISAMRS